MNTKREKSKISKKGLKALNAESIKSINGGGGTRILDFNSFDKTTIIKTKTGDRQIIDLNESTDEVWNPVNQQWMKIARKTNSTVTGIIYEITTKSGGVKVTSNHPFMKMDGTILHASQLTEGDVIDNGSSGDLITKVAALAIEGIQVFHNLVFENATEDVQDHFVEANGVVSGVLFLQDKVTQPVEGDFVVAV